MPHKRKSPAPEGQAPPPSWNSTVFAEQSRAVADRLRALCGGNEFKHLDLTNLRDELRRGPDDLNKLRQVLGPLDSDNFRKLAASLRPLRETAPPAEQNAPAPAAKRKTSNIDIPHIEDAIKQMRGEKPLQYVQQEIDRVIAYPQNRGRAPSWCLRQNNQDAALRLGTS